MSAEYGMGLALSLAAPYALVLAVPGPNLLVVISACVTHSWRAGAMAAVGVALGAAAAAAVAAAGAALVPANRTVALASAVIFCLFLVRAACKMVAAPVRPPLGCAEGAGGGRLEHFASGLAAAFLNPVTIPFFFSFFAARPDLRTPSERAFVVLVIFGMAAAWFGSLSAACSIQRDRLRLVPGLRPLRYGVAAGLLICAGFALVRAMIA
jgi:threonine/homoserine/homoserine lactone efflux protein